MTIERFVTFSKHEQLLILGSEFERARVWQYTDQEKFHMALDRALQIIKLLMSDPKWNQESHQLLFLKEEIKKFYIGDNKTEIGILYRAL